MKILIFTKLNLNIFLTTKYNEKILTIKMLKRCFVTTFLASPAFIINLELK